MADGSGRLATIRAALTPAEWHRVGAMAVAVVGLHVVGCGLLTLAVVGGHHQVSAGKAFVVGTGVLAYTLGMRHAFDADHIAAIDNTTRKLVGDGKRPLSVGFFFSLGHSSVVFLLAIALNFGIRALNIQVRHSGSALHGITGVIGASVSGTFLYLIAPLNKRVDQPWKMYPIGLLFGLGFDTATEVAFLVLAGTAVISGLPFYAVLSLPFLFAAGMSLFDTADGCFMNFAYDWAFARPVRKVYYNLTITGLSVFVAFFIGTVEILGLIGHQAHLTGGFWEFMAAFDINKAGLVIAGIFVVTWAVALAIWRFGQIEEKWDAAMIENTVAASSSPEGSAQAAAGCS